MTYFELPRPPKYDCLELRQVPWHVHVEWEGPAREQLTSQHSWQASDGRYMRLLTTRERVNPRKPGVFKFRCVLQERRHDDWVEMGEPEPVDYPQWSGWEALLADMRKPLETSRKQLALL